MGEYQEDDDFNDLLESDEEEDGRDQKQKVENENLLSLDDVVISEGTRDYKSKTKTIDFMFLPETLDDDDEDDNSTTGRPDSKNEENIRLELEKRRHFQRLLHSVPPGIDLFR